MSVAKSGIFIVGAKRTAFGAFGGALKTLSSTDLAVHSSKAAIAHAGVDVSKVDECIFGNVIPSSLDAAYLSRHVALKSGLNIATPSMNINRLCGSGFETAVMGAESIILGKSKVVLCGGTENMSQAPMAIDGLTARWGAQLGKGMKAEDTLWAGLTDSYAKIPMGITAENLAGMHDISREDSDAFALRSQQLWGKAHEAGVFKGEIAPIEMKGRKGPIIVETDEHPRPQTQPADLAKLKPVFVPEHGRVTAGSASGICDGSASMIVSGEAGVSENNLTPLTRIVSWSRIGVDPKIMGIGPVPAIRDALAAAGMTLDQMDLIEINEAFACQFLACQKELGFDMEKANTNGGAIALGHPLGASGARILTHLTHELVRTKKKYAIGAACIGGGQGIAVVLENATV